MPAQASQDHTSRQNGMPRRPRRQLLAGGTGGLAAVLPAEALARRAPAYAGTDGDVVLGAFNNETAATAISNTTSGGSGLLGLAAGIGSAGLAGQTDVGRGVSGDSDHGQALYRKSPLGEGVYAQSGVHQSGSTPSRNGVHGVTDSQFDSAVWGGRTSAVPG